MSIERNQIGQIDFSDVTVHGQLALVRPGDILRHDFMEPRGLSANALARGLNVPTNRITGILAGSRALTADTALRLERDFGMSAEAWLALQKRYELETARQASARLPGRLPKKCTRWGSRPSASSLYSHDGGPSSVTASTNVIPVVRSPVLHAQAEHAAEFAHVMRDQREVRHQCVGSNLRAERADGLSGAFKRGTHRPIRIGRTGVPRQSGDALQQAFNLMSQSRGRRQHARDAVAQFGSGDGGNTHRIDTLASQPVFQPEITTAQQVARDIDVEHVAQAHRRALSRNRGQSRVCSGGC